MSITELESFFRGIQSPSNDNHHLIEPTSTDSLYQRAAQVLSNIRSQLPLTTSTTFALHVRILCEHSALPTRSLPQRRTCHNSRRGFTGCDLHTASLSLPCSLRRFSGTYTLSSPSPYHPFPQFFIRPHTAFCLLPPHPTLGPSAACSGNRNRSLRQPIKEQSPTAENGFASDLPRRLGRISVAAFREAHRDGFLPG